MSRGLHEDFIKAARNRIDEPFAHHFEPDDYCKGGAITQASCYELGLGQDAYDCSGLVIASLCDVLNMSTQGWPTDLRHLRQLGRLSEPSIAAPGNLMVYMYPNLEDETRIFKHVGVRASQESLVHASQFSLRVEETSDSRYFEYARTIRLEKILTELGV